MVVDEISHRYPCPFTQWGFCWNVISALLVAASPDKGLSAYLALHYKAVADLLTAGRDWHFYDVSFRRAVSRGEAYWGWPKYDVYFAALSRPLTKKEERKGVPQQTTGAWPGPMKGNY